MTDTSQNLHQDSNLKTTEQRLTELETKIDKMCQDVEDLVTAWKASVFLLNIIKWISGIATGVVALLALVKGGKL